MAIVKVKVEEEAFLDDDLYGILGVSRQATDAQIKKAYRKKATKCHPDLGGSRDKFDQLKLAYDVLIDPVRRSKYDQTGVIDPPEPDNLFSQALGVISAFIDQVVGSLLQEKKNPINYDIVALLRHKIEEDIDQKKATEQAAENGIKIATRLLPKFKTKGEVNRLRQLVDAKIAQMRIEVRNLRNQISMREKALEILEECSFDAEPLVTQVQMQTGQWVRIW